MSANFDKEIFLKDPDWILDYSVDWSTWLGAETIATSLVVAPAGITLVSQSNTATKSLFRLSGGTVNNDYELIVTITTAPSGQSTQRGVIVQVRPIERLASILIATAGAANANSYATLAEAKTYFNWRLYADAWDEANDQQRETALLMACQRLEREDYVGIITDEADPPTQALKWPRQLNDSGDLIRNYVITAVPKPIKDAQCELALWYLQNTNAVTVNPEAIGKIKIGNSVEIETAANQSTSTLLGDVDYAGLPITAAQFLKGLRLHSVLA